MSKEKPNKIINQETMNSIADDLIKLFSINKYFLTKNECKKILNIIFEALFDEKLKKKILIIFLTFYLKIQMVVYLKQI